MSPPIKSRARRVNAINSVIVQLMARAVPPLAASASAHQLLFARTVIENRTHTSIRQPPRHFAIALRRPSLRSPARPGFRMANSPMPSSASRCPIRCSACDIRGKSQQISARRHLPRMLDQRLGDRKILLDHMSAARDHFSRVPQAGRRFPRLGRAVHHARPRQAAPAPPTASLLANHRNVVARVPHIVPNRRDAPAESKSKTEISSTPSD